MENLKNIKTDRFKRAISDSGLTASDIASRLGVDPQVVNNWKTRGIPQKDLSRVAKILSVDAAWLDGHEVSSSSGVVYTPVINMEILIDILTDVNNELGDAFSRLSPSKMALIICHEYEKKMSGYTETN